MARGALRLGIGVIAAVVFVWAAACPPAWADSMTGPIDLGTVGTGPIELNPTRSVEPSPNRHRPPSTLAHALDIKAFFGNFTGNGLADGADVAYFGVTQRDLDVKISPAADGGFTVAWTTVLRGGGDPKDPKVRRRETTMTFAPGPRPGLFHALDNGDPLTGGTISWARVSRNALFIRQFTVLDDGRHELQTYERTLSGSGMTLLYTRVLDGERTRRVRGKLVKTAD
jgi:hypothetical protein